MPTKINTWINNHKISEHTVRESVAEQPSAFLFSDQEQMCRVICNSEIYLAMATQHLLSEKKTKKKQKTLVSQSLFLSEKKTASWFTTQLSCFVPKKTKRNTERQKIWHLWVELSVDTLLLRRQCTKIDCLTLQSKFKPEIFPQSPWQTPEMNLAKLRECHVSLLQLYKYNRCLGLFLCVYPYAPQCCADGWLSSLKCPFYPPRWDFQ